MEKNPNKGYYRTERHGLIVFDRIECVRRGSGVTLVRYLSAEISMALNDAEHLAFMSAYEMWSSGR